MINIIASCCIEDKGKILMVQQNKEEYKKLWDFPGGKVEENEDIITAAKREVKEETGYSVNIDNILLMQNYITDKGVLLIIYFNASLKDSNVDTYNIKEIRNKRWFSLKEIKNFSNEMFRGKQNTKSIIDSIESGISYPLDMLEIYKA